MTTPYLVHWYKPGPTRRFTSKLKVRSSVGHNLNITCLQICSANISDSSFYDSAAVIGLLIISPFGSENFDSYLSLIVFPFTSCLLMLPSRTTRSVASVDAHTYMSSPDVHFSHLLGPTRGFDITNTKALSSASALTTSAEHGTTRSGSFTSSGSSSLVYSPHTSTDTVLKKRRKRTTLSQTSTYDRSSSSCTPCTPDDTDETVDATCSPTKLPSSYPPFPKRMRTTVTSVSVALFSPRGPGPPGTFESTGFAQKETGSSHNASSSSWKFDAIGAVDMPNSLLSGLVVSSDQVRRATNVIPSLPDEVLTCILRFIPTANELARLRLVCRQWCKLIDSTPLIWRGASFRHTRFERRVESQNGTLTLGDTCGKRVLEIAAKSGNEWGRFLHRTLLETGNLRAFTVPQPLATLMVAGKIARTEQAYLPWDNGHSYSSDSEGVWLAVHAARRGSVVMPMDVADGSMCRVEDGRAWPRGAVVGLIHVTKACVLPKNGNEGFRCVWHIDRAVGIRRPLRCAGFVEVWTMSTVLTELVILAVHSQ